MNPSPRLSIVVPTCGRPGPLSRLLGALASQAACPPFEVIVVGDGVPSDGVGVDAAAPWPFRLRVLTQPAQGPAVARNTGAAAARAPLLLFLDDDVEPSPAVVGAHLRFHEARGTESVGAGDLTPSPVVGGFIGAALSGWWQRMCDGLRDPRHRFTFRDLLTGHCSMPAALFARLGQFDPDLRCHEDFEFGYRAVRAGVPFGFVDAPALHHDATTLSGILARKRQEGRADLQLVARHPALLRALPLGNPVAGGETARRVFEAALEGGGRADALGTGLAAAMRVFEALGMRDRWRIALERAMDLAYWRGVAADVGGAAGVHELRGRPDLRTGVVLDLDLLDGIERGEARLDALRPAGVRLSLGREFVGELPEVPGAEPLRGVHLRPLLLKVFALSYARAAARLGLVPAPLVEAVGRTGGASAPARTIVPEPGAAPAA